MDRLADIDILVFAELQTAMGDDFLREMIDVFCDDSIGQTITLKKALAEQQQAEFTRAAHTLKSTSLIFGAKNFSDLAKELEQLGREGRLAESAEKTKLLCDSLVDLLESLKDLSYG